MAHPISVLRRGLGAPHPINVLELTTKISGLREFVTLLFFVYSLSLISLLWMTHIVWDIGGIMTHIDYPTGPVWTDVTAKLAITSFGAQGIPTIQIYTKEANPSDTFPNQSRHRAARAYAAFTVL